LTALLASPQLTGMVEGVDLPLRSSQTVAAFQPLTKRLSEA
jgi:hypothetical protein